MSFSWATGSTRRSTNSRTVSWIARCSSVNCRSTPAPRRRFPSAMILTGRPPAWGRSAGLGSARARHGEPLARPLGRVHGGVGGAEELLRVDAVDRAHGHAEAGAEAGHVA